MNTAANRSTMSLFRCSITPIPLLACLLLSACNHRRDPGHPDPTIAGLKTTTSLTESFVPSADGHWWTTFEDPGLNQWVSLALERQTSIARAWAAMKATELRWRQLSASQYPSLSITGSARREWRENDTGNSSSQDSGSLGLGASWELDFWGRIRSESEAARLDSLASKQDLETVATTVAAQVCQTWFLLAEKQGQQRLLRDQIENSEKTLTLLSTRFDLGEANATDWMQQQQAVEARKGAALQIDSEIQVLKHALQILAGNLPSEELDLRETPVEMPILPPFPELGIPVEMLLKRPDVRAAWLAVLSADASVAAAIANRFPRITLAGSLVSAFTNQVELMETWMQSISAALNLPLIDGGARKAEVDQRKVRLTQALLDYRQTMLEAMQEVEDAITQETHQQALLESIDRQVALARRVQEQSLQQYFSGTRSYLQVITTSDTLLNLERSRLTAYRNLLALRVSLLRATGGSVRLPESTLFLEFANPALHKTL